MDDEEKSKLKPKTKKIHPKQNANLLSQVFFCWPLPFFVKGYRKDLSEDDLYGPLKEHESENLGDKLENAWNKETNPSLWKALISVFGLEVAWYALPAFLIECVIKMSQPLFIGKLMEYYTPNEKEKSKSGAYLYGGGIVLMSFLVVLLAHSYILGLQHLGMRIRVACCSLIYRKSLKLSKTSLAETTLGQMVNLLSNDVNRFDMAVGHIHALWLCPLQTLIILYLLYKNLGLTSLVGILLFLLFIPVQMYLAKKTSIYRLQTALKTDQRVRLMNEIISGIQVIKMYTWEKPFAKLVDSARKSEIQQIKATSYVRAINMSFTIFLNRLAIYLCVLTYVVTGNTLQSQYVYVLTSFYGMLRLSLTTFLPQGITYLAETNVSIKRIQKFLSYDEIENAPNRDQETCGVRMKGASAKWNSFSPEYTLKNISLNVDTKQLVAVVGPVGSGKTTLLYMLLKELPILEGFLEIGGTISYASQEPWLFGGSIRQNILFGQAFDAGRYDEIVRVCALERDFSLFPYGDRTIVGERGTMLSGGQKARINLARAIYKDADIYLLDDPLSAVDTHVGKQLFDECITGYLRNKCVILVTHQLQYLKSVDRVYLLQNGSISMSGTYDELRHSGDEFLKLLQEASEENEPTPTTKDLENLQETEGPVETKEEKSSGVISKKVYGSYLKAGGNIFTLICVAALFVLTQASASGSDYFLTFWVNLEQERLQNSTETNITDYQCLYFYTSLIVLLILVTLSRSVSFFNVCMRASRNLHNKMFSRIVYATMRFFNLNPSGRILNRFSKDIGSIDESLPIAILDTIQIGLIAIAINIVVASVTPWILLPSVAIFALFYTLRAAFLATGRDLKRIEGTTRSPVFTHMSATIQGLTTIRAFGADEILKKEFDQHQNVHSSAFYMFIACNRAFGFWLDVQAVVYIALVILSFLFIGNETYDGNVGLGITQSITLTGMLQWGIRQWSELENQMTSVERVVEYTEITPEVDKPKKAPDFWPSEGGIEFKSVTMRYADDNPPVLKNLNFVVAPGEKIGIVGRTGAGKSSLIFALFRLSNLEGAIIIDGIDTKEISLQSLRSKISIIPQEPVLFSGTLRKNLDPFDEYNDDQLWEALEEVELKNAVADLPLALQTNVSEGGSNFSVGQRQLLCLARAVIRSNKILILDEATANVDPQTDELIQATIRRKFKDCTVLTIAHRLHTVMDCDKILVMDAGAAAEFDHPYLLLQNTSGIFYGLVQQTGKGMAESLFKIAQEHFKDVGMLGTK